jgi:hypothetical protein
MLTTPPRLIVAITDDNARRKASRSPPASFPSQRGLSERLAPKWPSNSHQTPFKEAKQMRSSASICLKPSVGLEPTTPSLPWRFRGKTSVHGRACKVTKALQIAALGDARSLHR